MRRLLHLSLVLPLSLLVLSSRAQHCAYDYASLIVVRPHAPGTDAVITGLRITLLDSNNLPVENHGSPRYLFLPNSDGHACGFPGHSMLHGDRMCFPFALDNYVLVVPSGFVTDRMKVLVQDERPMRNKDRRLGRRGIRYRQQLIPLTASDSYPLCGRYNDSVYPQLEGRPPYRPVDIVLELD